MPKLCPVCGETFADSSVFCPADGSTLRVERSSGDLVGSVIADRYQISKLLGEGGMGRVYLARHVRLPQQAAIKVLHPAMVQDPDAVARFNREAANAARIEHDRVARVFDFGETGEGMVYLAMEFVPGRTLRDILEAESRLPPVRAANIAYQISEGLDAAHRIGIVHRDLKPDNILVVTDDQGVDRCKVVDFGIAKAVDAGGTQLTRTGMIVGTPEFMSPEQVVGEAADARSDVYALALVTFQMMAGKLPFTGTTHERVLMSRLVGEPQTLGEAAPDVAWPEGLQEAFSRALQRDLDARTASALEFGEAVVAATEAWLGVPVLRGRTPLAMPAVSPTQAATRSTTAAGGVPTAAAALATPAPGAAAIGGGAAGATPPATGSATAPVAAPVAAPAGTANGAGGGGAARRSRTGLLIGGVVVAVAAGAWAMSQWSGSARTPVVEVAADSIAGDTGRGGADAGEVPRSVATTPTGEKAGERGGSAASGAQGAPSKERAGGTPTPDRAAETAVAAAPAPPPTAPPTPPRASDESARAAAVGLAAQRGVDSVVRVLTDERSGAREARAAVAVLQRLLRDVPTATDSAGVYLALVSAYGQSGEPQRACNPLRSARRLATTEAQLQAVNDFFRSEALACVP